MTFEDKARQQPGYFIAWYDDQRTQDFLEHLNETIGQWETIITSYTAITESEIPNVNRSLGSIQALKILKRYLDDLYAELTEPEDDEDAGPE